MAEMQNAINELAEALKKKKDDIIEIRGRTAREQFEFERIHDMSNEASQKDVDHEKENIDLLNEVDLKRLNENEIASKEWHEERFKEEKAEYREFRYTELRHCKDREVGLQTVMGGRVSG